MQTPLAAHSIVINDHRTGAHSGLGGESGKQAWSSLSECKCHREEERVCGAERRVRMVFVMAGNWWQKGVKSGMSRGGEGPSSGVSGQDEGEEVWLSLF